MLTRHRSKSAKTSSITACELERLNRYSMSSEEKVRKYLSIIDSRKFKKRPSTPRLAKNQASVNISRQARDDQFEIITVDSSREEYDAGSEGQQQKSRFFLRSRANELRPKPKECQNVVKKTYSPRGSPTQPQLSSLIIVIIDFSKSIPNCSTKL